MDERQVHPFEARLGLWPSEALGTIIAKRAERMMDGFEAELAMDMAHAVMLCEQEILSRKEAETILLALGEIRDNGRDAFPLDPTRSTLFWNVEAELIRRLGDHVGGKLHTGRSHNDILPTISRLMARDQILQVTEAVTRLQAVLLTKATNNTETVMPGYTSLQHSQPWTFGHYLVGWVFALERDVDRLRLAFDHTNRSPLGASALAGSSWPLDRSMTARLLGFDGVILHSRDAGFGTKDYVAEVLAALSIMMANVSSLCSDLYVWSSYEFGMIELSDGFSGTSSIMPQKKNPWAVDWARGAAGSMVGGLAASLASLRGATSTDGSAQDFPEAPLRDAVQTALDYLPLIAGAVETLQANQEVMRERAGANWSTASQLADTIVSKCDVSYRVAHSVVGRVVRIAVTEGLDPAAISGLTVDRAATEMLGTPMGLTDDDVREALDPMRFVQSRVTVGSVNPKEVKRMLGEAKRLLRAERRWLRSRWTMIRAAHADLEREVARLTRTPVDLADA